MPAAARKRDEAARLERLLAGLTREVEIARAADARFSFDVDFDIPVAVSRGGRRAIALRLTLRHRQAPVLSLVRRGHPAAQ